MAMDAGGGSGPVSGINVTPMIDILLVLLIIFMIIVPQTAVGLPTIIPQPPKKNVNQEQNQRTIVVQVLPGNNGRPTYMINQTPVDKSQLEPQLAAIFATRLGSDRVIFVKADPSFDCGVVADVINTGNQAGVENVALITPRLEAGQ